MPADHDELGAGIAQREQHIAESSGSSIMSLPTDELAGHLPAVLRGKRMSRQAVAHPRETVDQRHGLRAEDRAKVDIGLADPALRKIIRALLACALRSASVM